jgi:hypothetical protein
MYPSIELAGFAAAQAVCCLFDRQPLLPLAFSRRASDATTLTILSAGPPDVITAAGRRWLDDNVDRANAAVVVVDGYVTIAAARKDALILDLRSYRTPAGQMRMAVPYRPHHDPAGFAIHRPKFIVAALEGHDMAALSQAFVRGVSSHDTGARVWSACADESW